jgi:hypothetical protein
MCSLVWIHSLQPVFVSQPIPYHTHLKREHGSRIFLRNFSSGLQHTAWCHVSKDHDLIYHHSADRKTNIDGFPSYLKFLSTTLLQRAWHFRYVLWGADTGASTEFSSGFSRYFQPVAWVVPQTRLWPFPSISFPVHHSLIVLSLYAIWLEVLKASLRKQNTAHTVTKDRLITAVYYLGLPEHLRLFFHGNALWRQNFA